MKRACEICDYWDARVHAAKDAGTGFCRRDPPKVMSTKVHIAQTVWPATEPLEWCGEFEPRLEEE